jgi:lysophospholipase L1-like esterase
MADRVLGNARLYEMPKPRQGDDYNIDDNGFRSSAGTRDVFASFDAEALNVFAFGGSMTFGHGVRDAETWPAQLQKLLPAAKIYKVALFVDGGNEQCPEPADRSKPLRRLTERPPPMLALDWLLAKSSAVELLGRSRAKSEPADTGTSVSLQECAAKYARRTLLAQNLLASYGAIGIFAFQPSGSTIPNYATFKFWSYGNPSPGSVAQLNGLYDAYIGAARASGVKNVVDLRHILDDQALAGAELFVDHQHPSAAGHNLIAKEIRSLVERTL